MTFRGKTKCAITGKPSPCQMVCASSNQFYQRRFNLGVPIYYLLGRRLFGKTMKYPIMRLAQVPEKILSRRLYLDLRKPSKYSVPQMVEIPQPKARPAIPVLAD